jgi:uncharacterized iron-regulated membrane protein
MTHTPLARLRRLWLDVHLWIGVGLLVVLVPLSVSGAVLVWHDALDHALYGERYAVSGAQASLPAGAYADAARVAFGDRATLSQIRLPARAGDPVVAVGRIAGPPVAGGRPRTLNAWIDPPTGKVLATAEPAKGVSMTLHRLHGTLLIPQVGRKVVGWLGWAMFISSATGVWLWWPRHGGVLKGLRWRRGASQLFNLHHMIGFWLCLPLAVLSLTGVYISFPQTSRALFGVAAPTQGGAGLGAMAQDRQGGREGGRGGGDPRFAPPLAQPQQSVDQAVAAALATAPRARLSAISLPTAAGKPAWRIELDGADARAPIQVRVDDATGRARLGDAGRGGGGEGGPDPLSRWMRRIHDGTDLGPIWRTIITAAGIAPLVLSLTGVVMWLRRRARRLAIAAA